MRQAFDNIAILETLIALGGRRSGFCGLVVEMLRVADRLTQTNKIRIYKLIDKTSIFTDPP